MDAATTYFAIKQGGRELNPILLKLAEALRPITNAKWAWLVVAKVAAVALGYVLYVGNQPEMLAVVCAVYVYVVFHNIREMNDGK